MFWYWRHSLHCFIFSAVKAGMDHLTRALATDQAQAGVRVASLAPGVVGTEMQVRAALAMERALAEHCYLDPSWLESNWIGYA